MGIRAWAWAAATLGWAVLGAGCVDPGSPSGSPSQPWNAVTAGEVWHVSVAPDGAAAAIIRGTRSPSVVSFDPSGAEQWFHAGSAGESVAALGGDRVLVVSAALVTLHDRAGTTPLAIPPSVCPVDARVDGRGFVRLVVVAAAPASVGGQPIAARRGYIVTVSPAGALVGLDEARGAGCPRLLAVSPGGRMLVETTEGLFLVSGGVYTRYATYVTLDGDASVALADDGSIAVAQPRWGQLADGSSSGSVDVQVALVDPAGRVQWTRWVGGPGFDDVAGVGLGPDGRVYVAGTAQRLAASVVDPVVDFGTVRASIPATGSQTFLASWEPDGTLGWAAAPGSVGDDAATSLAMGADGSLVVGGWFVGAMDLPDGTHMASGGAGTRAGYVVRLDP